MYLLSGRQRQVGRGNTGPMGFYGVGALSADPSGCTIGPNTTGAPICMDISYNTPTSDCVGGYDQYGQPCTDFTSITNNPVATAAAVNYLNSAAPPSAPAMQLDLASIIAALTPGGSPSNTQTPPKQSTTNWLPIIALGGGAFIFLMAMSGGRR